ncbi:metal-dependent hydrolase [Erythrobacter sp. sf7]|uniref:Metal-dependent hydrolase n=1 Tax=Erythrobacter fulvus TaxID=2987523 RepID=A0ABT5JL50_9SPHN|nr:metal-dependent hydrolase [Erythrobacter fulvus]MDC8753472.1 metal-dependent hydrolase [Erythrobacter fulvus]
MDNLTHSLVGAVLGQAGLKRTTGLAMPALIIGANLPDLDAACFFWLEGTEHLGFRRGITHGPPALVLLPLVLAGILWGFDRWQTQRGTRPEGRLPVRFGWLYAMAFIGCLSHPFFDWLNVYGIRLLEPFSSQWFYGDTLFIIDPWLWAMLIASVGWSWWREKLGGDQRPIARGAIAIMLVYIGVNGAITWLDNATRGTMTEPYPEAYIAAPAPLTSWRREQIAQLEDGRWISSDWKGSDFGYGYANSDQKQCRLPDLTEARRTNSQLDAFLFWSRAPLGVRAEDGSVILYDARFYDPRSRDRFSIALPDVKCEELPAG